MNSPNQSNRRVYFLYKANLDQYIEYKKQQFFRLLNVLVVVVAIQTHYRFRLIIIILSVLVIIKHTCQSALVFIVSSQFKIDKHKINIYNINYYITHLPPPPPDPPHLLSINYYWCNLFQKEMHPRSLGTRIAVGDNTFKSTC